MIYFTSDNHFYHKAVIKFCNRPFLSVEEMNEKMINMWNMTVGPEDTVIVVGDFCFGNSQQRADILAQLNGGTKILVQGNHDKGNKTPKGFDLMVRDMSMTIAGQKVSIKHYPLKWDEATYHFELGRAAAEGRVLVEPRYLDRMPVDRGQIHIHGHTHSFDKFNKNQIHVGVDAWDFKPVSIKQIERYVSQYTAKENKHD